MHGLGYAGRAAESFAAADVGRGAARTTRTSCGSTRGRRAGCCGWSTTTSTAPAPIWRRSPATALAARASSTPRRSGSPTWPAPNGWPGAWDDALVHAERAVAINLESDFGFMQSAVIGIAVLVPAGRGDWAAAEAYVAADGASRPSPATSAPWSRWACPGPGSARPAATPAAVLAALEPVRAVPAPGRRRRAGVLALAGPLRRRAGRRRAASTRPTRSSSRTSSWRGSAGAGRRSPGWPGPAAGSRPRPAGPSGPSAAFARALDATEDLDVPFERAPHRAGRRASSCGGPGSGGGRPTCSSRGRATVRRARRGALRRPVREGAGRVRAGRPPGSTATAPG